MTRLGLMVSELDTGKIAVDMTRVGDNENLCMMLGATVGACVLEMAHGGFISPDEAGKAVDVMVAAIHDVAHKHLESGSAMVLGSLHRKPDE